MKSLTTFLFGLISICASAQIQITDSLVNSFLQNKINNINFKLFEAAINGKITAYKNDSFTSHYSKSDILLNYTQQYSTDVSKFASRYVDGKLSSEFEEYIDTNIVIQLDQKRDWQGLQMTFHPTFSKDNGTVIYENIGVSPIFTFIAEGIELSGFPLFYIRTKHLDSVLNNSELDILKSLITQTYQFGDFRIFEEKNNDGGIYSTSYAFEVGKRSLKSYSFRYVDYIDYKNNLLTEYIKHIPTIVMSRVATNQEVEHLPKITLFKNLTLKTAYDNPTQDLSYEYIVPLYDNYNDINYDTVLIFGASFFRPINYNVWSKNDDFIFEFTEGQFGCEICDGRIFMSFNTVKKLFPEQDRIVWEAFLKDLFPE